jgi:hypothetical protein
MRRVCAHGLEGKLCPTQGLKKVKMNVASGEQEGVQLADIPKQILTDYQSFR